MASTITAPAYDPTTTAQALAEKSTATLQAKIQTDTTTTTATAKALSTLSSAISAFQGSLSTLTGLGKSVLAQSATLSDTSIASASAKSSAASGTYSLFVKQVATAGQVSYNGLADGATLGGTLKVKLQDENSTTATPLTFDVDLSAANADTDKDGVLSVRELASAINRSSGNAGQVSAGVVTIGTETRLVLTSKNTGVANTISLDPSGATGSSLQTGLATSNRTMVTAAQDAIVMLGGENGTAIKQSSNTFTNIDGVSFTVSKAQSTGSTPVTLTVSGDSNGTTKNVQSFVDAYNKLKSAIDSLVDAGDPANKVSAGAFAHDAGVSALQSRLVSLMRPLGATSLASYGITANRDGSLSLDSARLTKQLAVDPTGLDKLLGSASISNPSGVAGSLNTYLNQWSNSATGQIKTRTDANNALSATLTKRQADLDTMYNSAYSRYLKQYTDLQALQSTMNSNLSMFDALFSSDKS
ncbi:flagellar filament capping protein FliD [Massilia phyllosphaerae]|uniref:flagellar filament capping protein FliD n=1 Tax=Massilia phyllosphaerae TaxID=3106034 RepID=UPI002B1CE155|nr:flagellar filament capping protein FliD [Massilia sp. SGZ-792]